MPPSRCLNASDVSTLPSLGDFVTTVSRPLRAIQPILKWTARSDWVNWQLEVSGGTCSCQSRTAKVRCQISNSLRMSHLLQGTSDGTRHWSLSNGTEPLVLAQLSGSHYQYWWIIIDYDQSTNSHFTRRGLHVDGSVCPALMLKPTQVLHTTAKCFLACASHFTKGTRETALTTLESLITCHWCCRNRPKDKPYSVG